MFDLPQAKGRARVWLCRGCPIVTKHRVDFGDSGRCRCTDLHHKAHIRPAANRRFCLWPLEPSRATTSNSRPRPRRRHAQGTLPVRPPPCRLPPRYWDIALHWAAESTDPCHETLDSSPLAQSRTEPTPATKPSAGLSHNGCHVPRPCVAPPARAMGLNGSPPSHRTTWRRPRTGKRPPWATHAEVEWRIVRPLREYGRAMECPQAHVGRARARARGATASLSTMTAPCCHFKEEKVRHPRVVEIGGGEERAEVATVPHASTLPNRNPAEC